MRDHTHSQIDRLKANGFGTSILKFRPSAFSLQPKSLIARLQPEPLQPKPLACACLLLIAITLISSVTTSASAPPSVADETMAQGTQAFQRGSYDEALGKLKEAARQYDAQGQAHQQSQALVAAARAAESLGQTRQALQLLELASALAQNGPDTLWRATVLAQLGHTYLTARQLDAASTHLTQARELTNRALSPALTASLLNDLGILHALQNHPEEALAAFTDTVQLAQQAGLPLVALHARLNAARTNLQLNQPENSRLWIDQALEQVTTLPPSREKAIALMNIGLLYHRLLPSLPDLHAPLVLRAAGTLQEAASLAEQLGDARTLSFALGHLGHVYELEQRLDEALSFTRRAIFAAQSVDAPESLYRWQWQLGRQLAATGKLDEAIASYRQASGTLQPIRPAIAVAAADSSWSDEDPIRPLFFELADLLLQRASLTEEPPAAAQYLLAARDAIEAYKAAELRDYFKDECVDALQARLTKFDRLAANTAVIYPILFPTRLELLVSLPSGLIRYCGPGRRGGADEGNQAVSPHGRKTHHAGIPPPCATAVRLACPSAGTGIRKAADCDLGVCAGQRAPNYPHGGASRRLDLSHQQVCRRADPRPHADGPAPVKPREGALSGHRAHESRAGISSPPLCGGGSRDHTLALFGGSTDEPGLSRSGFRTEIARRTVWDLAHRHAWQVFHQRERLVSPDVRRQADYEYLGSIDRPVPVPRGSARTPDLERLSNRSGR